MSGLWNWRPSQRPKEPKMPSPAAAHPPAKLKSSVSQPFAEDESSEGEERAPSEVVQGNFIRQIPHDVARAPIAKMQARKDVFNIDNVANDDMAEVGESEQRTKRTGPTTKSKPTPPSRVNVEQAQTSGDHQSLSSGTVVSSLTTDNHDVVIGSIESEEGSENADVRNERKRHEGKPEARKGADASEDESDSEIPEGEFKVECILSHQRVKGGNFKLLVKWEGYDEDKDNTWEPEASIRENASEVVDNYFEQIGGRPGRKSKTKKPKLVKKLVARSPSLDELITKTDIVPKKVTGRQVTNLDGGKSEPRHPRVTTRQIISSDEDGMSDVDGYRIPTPLRDESSAEFPPEPKRNSWDDLIERIEFLQEMSDNDCMVGVHWLAQDNDGVRYKTRERYQDVRLAAPTCLLDYYETVITFDGSTGLPSNALQHLDHRDSKTNEGDKTKPRKRPQASPQMIVPSRPKKPRH